MTQEAKAVLALLNRASRAEHPVIENVALAAGYLWRCQSKYCATVNPDGHGLCSKCGLGRPGLPKP